jgi:hypothetical protein
MGTHEKLIHDSDWNILIILDAMRYDYFEKYNTTLGDLQKVYSGASCTIEWLKKNFPEKYPYVYVSGNPNCTQRTKVSGFRGGDHFTEVVDAWKHGWNNVWLSVLPDGMTRQSIPHLREDKVILHYMQPHGPYLNLKGEQYGWVFDNFHVTFKGMGWYRNIAIEDYVKGYEYNVDVILKEMNSLLRYIPPKQKVVITSDHGQLLGEHRARGHPCSTPYDELVDVPWLEVER